jgi:transposase
VTHLVPQPPTRQGEGPAAPRLHHILAAVRALNRSEVVGDTLRHALNRLAVVAPEWLRTVRPPAWKERYARRAEDERLPTTQAARAALTCTLGYDGWRWLSAVDHAAAPRWRREVPAVALGRRVWIHNDQWDGTPLQWREVDNLPPMARFLSSPSDAEAHDARKPTTPWVGYQVPLTATGEDDLRHLTTHVATPSGPAADGAATPKIHTALQPRDLLPGTPIVETGFLDADLVVESRDDDDVDLLGPTRLDSHGQAREGAGVDAQHFQIHGDRQHVTCPAGKTSTGWTSAVDSRGNAVIKVKCSMKDGRQCDPRAQCIRSTTRDPRRTLTIRPQPQDQALQAARQRAATATFQAG